MISYAGIGSRHITQAEERIILSLSEKLSKMFVVYSGNADGSDISFQKGSNGKCVIFLPWEGFNNINYDPKLSLNYYVVGEEKDGNDSINIYHPNPSNLSKGARALMARNYYQVNGYEKYPKVSFVVCCADPRGESDCAGGTGQAVRIASKMGIPIFNIRIKGWKDQLREHIKNILLFS